MMAHQSGSENGDRNSRKSLAIYYHLHCRFPNCIANLELNSNNTAELMTD